MRVDFKEIPKANTGRGDQDTFELFARDFLKTLGLLIIRGPGRGADGGRDLIVREERKGIIGTTIIDWLVSCKHHAHSGESVRPKDEQSIDDRVKSKNCVGFMGFYSTIPSEALVERLSGLIASDNASVKEYQFFDGKRIERELLDKHIFLRLLARYFPNSHRAWVEDLTTGVPVSLFKRFVESVKHEPNWRFHTLLEAVFGSLEAAIMPLKKSTSFEQLMREGGITCLHAEILDRFHEMETQDFLNPETDQPFTMGEIEQLIQGTFESIKLGDFVQAGIAYIEGKQTASYYLYEKYVIYNKDAQHTFDLLFKELKEILAD